MEPLQPDISYPVFNHANGFENVFRKEENFYCFLEKYRLYISPIAETYVYCLMPITGFTKW
jgi:putative transposase